MDDPIAIAEAVGKACRECQAALAELEATVGRPVEQIDIRERRTERYGEPDLILRSIEITMAPRVRSSWSTT